MAKRLSKALRGKRRWFGLAVNESLDSRRSVESVLKSIISDLELVKKLRLMDFVQAGSEKVTDLSESKIKPEIYPHGLAIVEVPLEYSTQFRELLSQKNNISEYGLESLTMSGKIRLVRDRLNLEKPKRKR
ncbi:MAG: hypothetical protein P8Q95_07015 [Candidatus Poseidoniaceae archaeon]|nr:hypothetical protein [Candidatus Poseidoniaceae archaeon]